MSEKESTLDDFVQQSEDSKKESNTDQSKINLSRLDEHISIIKGTKPDRVKDEQHDGSEPYLVVSTLKDTERKYTPDTDGPKATPQDMLMIMDGSKSGRVYRGEHGVIGSTMAAIRPEGTNSHYLQYFLESNFERLNSATKGSAVPHTDKDLLRSLKYPVYPLSEQRKIATVLYTVDQAIEKTEKIMSKTRRLRQGLAQDIFREGLHADEKKETWLGNIPASWNVVQFSEIVDSNRNGLYKTKDAYGHGSPIAKMGNALENRVLDMSSADRLELTEKEKEKYGLEQGDLIFARRAQEVSAAGDCCYVPTLDELTVFTSSLIRVRLIEDMNPKFYVQYFDGPVGSRSIDRITTETSISGIATSDLLDLKVAVPDIKEQNEIASILWGFDEQIWSLQREISQYKRLKKGLMQDLLSGTVRTTDTNITVPDEVAQHG